MNRNTQQTEKLFKLTYEALLQINRKDLSTKERLKIAEETLIKVWNSNSDEAIQE